MYLASRELCETTYEFAYCLEDQEAFTLIIRPVSELVWKSSFESCTLASIKCEWLFGIMNKTNSFVAWGKITLKCQFLAPWFYFQKTTIHAQRKWSKLARGQTIFLNLPGNRVQYGNHISYTAIKNQQIIFQFMQVPLSAKELEARRRRTTAREKSVPRSRNSSWTRPPFWEHKLP